MSPKFETLNEYQKLCIRTTISQMDEKMTHLAWSLALAGEAGELANRTKKVFIHGHPYDQDKVVEELGDILWYVAVYAHDIGVDLQELAVRNIDKLEKRYPDGFSSEASIRRDD